MILLNYNSSSSKALYILNTVSLTQTRDWPNPIRADRCTLDDHICPRRGFASATWGRKYNQQIPCHFLHLRFLFTTSTTQSCHFLYNKLLDRHAFPNLSCHFTSKSDTLIDFFNFMLQVSTCIEGAIYIWCRHWEGEGRYPKTRQESDSLKWFGCLLGHLLMNWTNWLVQWNIAQNVLGKSHKKWLQPKWPYIRGPHKWSEDNTPPSTSFHWIW